MANENNDISDIVKKCKILLLDIEGTTTSISFVKEKLFPYAEDKVKDFLTNQWDSEELKESIVGLRKLALEEKAKDVVGVVTIPGEDAAKEDQIEGLVNSVKWLMAADRKVIPLKLLQGLIWKEGYDNGDIKGHVYEDVSPALEQWRSVEGQKVYIFSSGSVQAQKLHFGQSVAGDMLKFIDGHFDTYVGAKHEATSYTSIAGKIGCKPEEILYLTDVVKEAEAARAAGLHAALVSREGNLPLSADAVSSFPVLYSLATLANPNKRKPDAQDEQPAKVMKTDVDADVKTASETEVTAAKAQSDAKAPSEPKVSSEPKAPESKSPAATKTLVVDKPADETVAPIKAEATPVAKENIEVKDTPKTIAAAPETITAATSETVAAAPETIAAVPETIAASSEKPAPKTSDEPEKMDVEEEEVLPVTKVDKAVQAKMDVVADKEETIVEEVTDSNEIEDTPICDIEPIIEESSDKTEKPETEKMETETSEPVPEPKESAELKNGEKVAPVPEETPPVSVITEIKDVTNDKEELSEVAEMIEDLEPVVEEPADKHDMDELQNVGEVLEKECDEILSKVQDVTNLDNIPLKPLLNTIAEETMETENLDSNDIVERILDSEMEMEMKQTEEKEKALKAAEKASESKIVAEGDKIESLEVANNDTAKVVPEEKPTEKVLEAKATNVNVANNVPISGEEGNKVATDDKETKPEAEENENKMETEVITPETDGSKTKVAEDNTDKVAADKKLDTEEKKVEAVKPEPEKKVESVKPEPEKKVEAVKPEPEKKVEAVKPEPEKKVEDIKPDKKEMPAEPKEEKMETAVDAKECQKVSEEAKPESEPKEKEIKEAHVNGKATNGEAEIANQNGDSSKEEELSSRLSIGNGKESVNGANGDSAKEDQGKTENIPEVDVADIKVKTVAVDEPRNDPIEQPTEA